MTEAEVIVPTHIGIIMDGNGRWAKLRGLPRSEGHRAGMENAKTVVKAAIKRKVKYLSLFVFSTENWQRARSEVAFLMGLIKRHLSAEFDFYRENKIRVVHSGSYVGLPADVIREIEKVASDTAHFDQFVVNLAINYGGRDEIVRAAAKIAAQGLPIDASSFSAYLDQPGLPDIDLLIRTSNEHRISNFMLWQTAYAELWFTEKLWPDFKVEDLETAIADFARRDRRFGGEK